MSRDFVKKLAGLACLPAIVLALPALGNAQVPVDEDGNPVAAAESLVEDIPLLSAAELEELVGPIALYPDDLLAIVLPASTYPLQLIQAERFLQELEHDSTLKPDESWDDSVVALLNYPEVIEMMTEDLDKTWRLGEAVVSQQADVIAAIESFRDRAYAAGNLKSDEHQTVSESDGVIEIEPVAEDVIYVPYYEPETVVVYQPRPVYYYYPRRYPVYYYPYPAGYAFHDGYFWGVTTAFTVGWFTDSLFVHHHSYHGHPYYGHSYWHNYWYRRPTVHVHNTYYYNGNRNYSDDRYYRGDNWRPGPRSTVNVRDQRVTRSRHYPGSASSDVPVNINGSQSNSQPSQRRTASRADLNDSTDLKFRQRTSTVSNQASAIRPSQARSGRQSTVKPTAIEPSNSQPAIKFRGRSSGENPATGRIASFDMKQLSRSSQPSRTQPEARITGQSTSRQPAARTTRPSSVSSPPVRSSQAKISRPSTRSDQTTISRQPAQSNQRSISAPTTRTSNTRISRASRSSSTSVSRQPARSSSPSRLQSSKPATGNFSTSSKSLKQQRPGARR